MKNESKTQGSGDAIAKLDAVFNPLTDKIGDALAAIETMDDSEVWTGLYAVEKGVPLNPEDRAFSEAESIILCALRAEHASRLAKSATWLSVSVQDGDDGRFCLRVYHDAGEVLHQEFETEAEAWAAGNALLALLELEGRAVNARDELSGQIEGFFGATPCPASADADPCPF